MTEPLHVLPPSPPPRAKGITRNQPDRSWYARITRRRWKYAKYFRDREFGGDSAAALAAAQAWLAELQRKLPAPLPIRDRMTSRNRSGFVGVRRVTEVVKRLGGLKYYHWEGRWQTGKAGRKFSILKYGEDRAFLLACVARDIGSGDVELCLAEFERRQRDGRNHALLLRKREFDQEARTRSLLATG